MNSADRCIPDWRGFLAECWPECADDVLSRIDALNVASSDAGYVILPGFDSVMLSAPHAVPQIRNGKEKQAESATGALAAALAWRCGCSAIVKTVADGDANYDDESSFRDAVRSHVLSNGISFLFDLHLLRPDREFDVAIGTGSGRNIFGRDDVTALLVEALSSAGCARIGVDELFRALTPNTVSASTARSCRIPCYQVEINSRFFLSDYPDYRPRAIASALSEVVDKCAVLAEAV